MTILQNNVKLSAAQKRKQLALARSLHASYADFNQQEDKTSITLANAKHPNAAIYCACRKQFDALAFACNSNARLMALNVDDKGNSSFSIELWAPTLSLPWNCFAELDGEYFGHIYPAHKRWPEYVQARINAGLSGIGWELNGGQILIRTQYSATAPEGLAESVAAYIRDGKGLSLSSRQDSTYTQIGITFIRGLTVARFQGLIRLIKQHCRGGLWLPKRSPADNEADNAIKPLAEREVMLGNVEKLTDNGRVILIPLIPLDDPGLKNAAKLCNDLLDKVEQGLPFRTAKPFLADWLTKKRLNELSKRYAK